MIRGLASGAQAGIEPAMTAKDSTEVRFCESGTQSTHPCII